MSYVYSASQNNGKILQSTDNVTGETVNYTYDALNRLISAQATAGGWGETYTYDGFGNMGSGFSAATNRTSTQSADANGNSTASGYTWDMENRLLSAVSGTFWAYDPHGKRVFTEVSGSNTTCEVDFYGIGGRKLAAIPCQYDTSGVFSTGTPLYNVYFGGKLIRSKNVTVVTDRLGSVRGTSNDEVMRYTPYGTERTSTADGREKWGTYIRDAGTGNDYADQRYKGVGMAEFLSPDPGGIMTARPKNPESWNRYAHVVGDPINFTDRHGLIVDAEGCIDDPDMCENQDWECYQSQLLGVPDPSCGNYGGGGDGDEGANGGNGDSDPPPSCEQVLQSTITSFLTSHGSPLASYAGTFVTDAQNAGLNPYLLVAIAGAESQFGTKPNSKANDNAFGLLHRAKGSNGRYHWLLNNYSNSGGWAAGIQAAANAVDNQFVIGNVTVALMYGGQQGAYCQGNCTAGKQNVESYFIAISALGGNQLNPNQPTDLLWPCND